VGVCEGHLASDAQIRGQGINGRRVEGHEAALSEFRVPDEKSVASNVTDLKCERLSDPEAGRRQETKQRAVRPGADAAGRTQRRRDRDDVANLLRGEHVGAALRSATKDSRRRNFVPRICSFQMPSENDGRGKATQSGMGASRTRRPLQHGLGAHMRVAACVGEGGEVQEDDGLHPEFVPGSDEMRCSRRRP